MATVQLKNVKKVYPFVSGEDKKKNKKKADEPEKKKVNLQITDEGVVAVQAFNLDIADKEFIVLVGPSGCGKSTTLRMVAGLEEISGGELYIDGKLMNDVIGVGHIGRALIDNFCFSEWGIDLIQAFDVEENLIGNEFSGVHVSSMEDLTAYLKRNKVDIVVLTVPREAALPT